MPSIRGGAHLSEEEPCELVSRRRGLRSGKAELAGPCEGRIRRLAEGVRATGLVRAHSVLDPGDA